MAEDGEAAGRRARINALAAGLAIGIVAIAPVSLWVGSWTYGTLAGLMLGVSLAAILMDRVTRRRQRRGEEEPPS